VLEAPETAQVKQQANGDDFAFGHDRRTLGSPAKKEAGSGFVKIFTELVDKTENIVNFIDVNHSGNK